jgi:hypothetical protein
MLFNSSGKCVLPAKMSAGYCDLNDSYTLFFFEKKTKTKTFSLITVKPV